jgi:hypothetical protein
VRVCFVIGVFVVFALAGSGVASAAFERSSAPQGVGLTSLGAARVLVSWNGPLSDYAEWTPEFTVGDPPTQNFERVQVPTESLALHSIVARPGVGGAVLFSDYETYDGDKYGPFVHAASYHVAPLSAEGIIGAPRRLVSRRDAAELGGLAAAIDAKGVVTVAWERGSRAFIRTIGPASTWGPVRSIGPRGFQPRIVKPLGRSVWTLGDVGRQLVCISGSRSRPIARLSPSGTSVGAYRATRGFDVIRTQSSGIYLEHVSAACRVTRRSTLFTPGRGLVGLARAPSGEIIVAHRDIDLPSAIVMTFTATGRLIHRQSVNGSVWRMGLLAGADGQVTAAWDILGPEKSLHYATGPLGGDLGAPQTLVAPTPDSLDFTLLEMSAGRTLMAWTQQHTGSAASGTLTYQRFVDGKAEGDPEELVRAGSPGH